MYLKCYKSETCINDLLLHMMESGERMTKESPVANYEMIGRLFIVYGVVCKTAGEMYELEKESRRTFFDLMKSDYVRHIAVFDAQRTALRKVLGSVPLFRDRDYQKYPQVTVEDIPSVREEFMALEQLPFCGYGKVNTVYFDATALAYKMFDMIFLGLEGIIKFLQGMYDHQQMLPVNPGMCVQRWQWMLEDYCKKEWVDDKQLFQKRLDDHISQHGCNKESLTLFLNQFDNDATNQMVDGLVATLNRHYLDQEDHVSFVFENRDKLTREQMVRHLQFIHCRKLLEQEIELCDLRQPALGAYADLFTSRAAQGMAELLSPIIARHVDFRHNYHYAAWAIVMREKGLVYADRRNGSPMATFINKTFGEQIDKTSLNRYLNKDGDFEKIKEQYDVILAIVNQALGREPKKDYFRSEGLEFFERVAILRKAIQR